MHSRLYHYPGTVGTDVQSEAFVEASVVWFVTSGILNIGIVRMFSVGASISIHFFFPSRYSHSQCTKSQWRFNHIQSRVVASLALNLRAACMLYTSRCLIYTHTFYTSLSIWLSTVGFRHVLATRTLSLHSDFLGNLKRLARVDNVYNDTWSCCLKVLEEGSCVTSICVW